MTCFIFLRAVGLHPAAALPLPGNAVTWSKSPVVAHWHMCTNLWSNVMAKFAIRKWNNKAHCFQYHRIWKFPDNIIAQSKFPCGQSSVVNIQVKSLGKWKAVRFWNLPIVAAVTIVLLSLTYPTPEKRMFDDRSYSGTVKIPKLDGFIKSSWWIYNPCLCATKSAALFLHPTNLVP